MTSTASFPDYNIDPKNKGFDWVLQFAKAAYNGGKGGMPYTILHRGANEYREIYDYAAGQQSVNKFKKVHQPDRQDERTEMNLDWTVSPIIPKYRTIAIAKLSQREYTLEATAIDADSRTEQDNYYNEAYINLQMRKMIEQSGSSLSQNPLLQKQQSEPEDEEALEMAHEFGFKNQFAMSAEMAIDYVFLYNSFKEERQKFLESQFDIGFGGYKLWLDEKGMVHFRAVKPDRIITSYCEESNFSDAQYIGEAVMVPIQDLAPYYTPNQLEEIAKANQGLNSNPADVNYNALNWWANFQVLVFDLQFMNYDTFVYNSNVDKYGNERFSKTDFSNLSKTRKTKAPNGELEPKYLDDTEKNVYSAKWIVGTDFMYEWGPMKNQARKLSSWWDTQMDYILYSWNFNKMNMSGIMRRLIPLEDEFYETRMKLQDLKNKLIPYLIKINLDALENLNFGSGGVKWGPKEAIDFAFSNRVAVFRTKDLIDSNSPNLQQSPIDVQATAMVQDLLSLGQELQRIKQDIRDVSGLNEVTDGSAPNPKMSNVSLNMTNQATNNALYKISFVDELATYKLADLIVMKVQCAVSKGKFEGYTRALDSNTVKTFQISDGFSLREFAIGIQDAPTQEERQMLLQDLQMKESQGMIDPADKYYVMTCKNLKQAMRVLAYRIRKRKEEAQQQAMQQQQQNAQIQMQSNAQAEQMKQQSDQLKSQLKINELNVKGEWDYRIAELQANGRSYDGHVTADAKRDTMMISKSIDQNQGENMPNNDSQGVA